MKEDVKPAAVIFCSGESTVLNMAQCVLEGMQEENDVAVQLIMEPFSDRLEAVSLAGEAELYLFGVTQTGIDVNMGMWDIASAFLPGRVRGKKASMFGNGLSGGAFTDSFADRLKFLGFDTKYPNLFVPGILDEEDKKRFYEFGYDLRCNLLKKTNHRRRKLVKCLVCGEIFDSSLGICPVCGVGLELCVPVEDDTCVFHQDSDKRYVIIGGGVAGLSAAEAIRSRDGTGGITIVSAENELPINRPMLTKDFEKSVNDSSALLIHDKDWYEEKSIEVICDNAVRRIDAENKSVSLLKGGKLSYDKLIYAAGAECFVPPFKGKEKNGVITIRHISDSKKVMERIKNGAKKAVVIGGGVLGLEAASELMRLGLAVTVLEASPQIIGRQADRASADELIRIMKNLGIHVEEAVSIEEITGDENADGVMLSDGRVFPTDFVVVSCGNRGNISMAQEAGIHTGRSIIVDPHMRTNITDIYACGDCAEYDGINYQLWQEAIAQGKVAGANAAGDEIIYERQMLGLSLEAFGTYFYSIGDAGKTALGSKMVSVFDDVGKRQKRMWFGGRHLQGAVLIGYKDEIVDIQKKVIEHARYDEIF